MTTMLRVAITSDFHGALPTIPDVDLLLIAGDIEGITASWLSTLTCPVVGIAGNHDFDAQRNPDRYRALPWTYLQNSGTTICGKRIWGSPHGCRLRSWAFNEPEHELEPIWAQIPDDTQILITHAPPFGRLDTVLDGRHVGCETLANRIAELKQLELFACGHIHESYGVAPTFFRPPIFVNGSHMDVRYQPINPPIIVQLPQEGDA